MALLNKTAIETEFTNKAAAIMAITPTQVDSTLAAVDAFAVQVSECEEVLLAREALNARALTGGEIDSLSTLVANVRSSTDSIRAAVVAIQAALQRIGL
jgi:hypothetical protein